MADPCISFLTAVCLNGGIGNKGKLPWPFLRNDYEYYIKLLQTVKAPGHKNIAIYGNATWRSAQESETSHENVLNVIMSRTLKDKPKYGKCIATNFEEALEYAKQCEESGTVIDNIFVMGGQQIYELALKHPRCKRIYKTQIFKDYECDTFFPELPKEFSVISYPDGSPDAFQEDNGVKYQFQVIERI